jgi:hypothetical protein
VLDDMELLLAAVDAVNQRHPGPADGLVSRDDVRVYLNSARGVPAILRVYDAVQSRGVHSIPTVVADGQLYQGHVEAQGLSRRLRQIATDPRYTVHGKKLFNFLEDVL